MNMNNEISPMVDTDYTNTKYAKLLDAHLLAKLCDFTLDCTHGYPVNIRANKYIILVSHFPYNMRDHNYVSQLSDQVRFVTTILEDQHSRILEGF